MLNWNSLVLNWEYLVLNCDLLPGRSLAVLHGNCIGLKRQWDCGICTMHTRARDNFWSQLV